MDIAEVLDMCRNIGTTLKTARVIQANISAEELHQRSGIAESTILKIENGGDVKFSTVLKLFDTLYKYKKERASEAIRKDLQRWRCGARGSK